MTGPDRRVVAALDRRGAIDRDGLRRATRLAATTLDVSIRKLERMGLVATDGGRHRVTAKGRHIAKGLRDASDGSTAKGV
jgi:DNA-binding MarR family transcriptional regulator